MRELAAELASEKIPIVTEISLGAPAELVCACAKEKAIDLIVTSTHGRSGWRNALLGSTAERVVRHAGCPVLVVPTREADQPSPRQKP
jgi:nucleotide-binding universal stress UspA family protein